VFSEESGGQAREERTDKRRILSHGCLVERCDVGWHHHRCDGCCGVLVTSALALGSGPNGLAAAITLAQEGVEVTVVEAADSIGGGLRSSELTMPGLLHDHCAAIVPTAVSSPFMQSLDLEAHGVRWAWPDIDLVHPAYTLGVPSTMPASM
jgi:NADPH-dependent 2,4-dienoyl-CoA reductase/sulfur reductase-like enzyme